MCSSVARKLCDWIPFVVTGISCDYYCFVCRMSLEGAATEAMKTNGKTEMIGANAGQLDALIFLCTNRRCQQIKMYYYYCEVSLMGDGPRENEQQQVVRKRRCFRMKAERKINYIASGYVNVHCGSIHVSNLRIFRRSQLGNIQHFYDCAGSIVNRKSNSMISSAQIELIQRSDRTFHSSTQLIYPQRGLSSNPFNRLTAQPERSIRGTAIIIPMHRKL